MCVFDILHSAGVWVPFGHNIPLDRDGRTERGYISNRDYVPRCVHTDLIGFLVGFELPTG